MKTTQETLDYIRNKYAFQKSLRDNARELQNLEEQANHISKAKQLLEAVNEHQSKMNTLVQVYAFIKGIDWTEAGKELIEFAKQWKESK